MTHTGSWITTIVLGKSQSIAIAIAIEKNLRTGITVRMVPARLEKSNGVKTLVKFSVNVLLMNNKKILRSD